MATVTDSSIQESTTEYEVNVDIETSSPATSVLVTEIDSSVVPSSTDKEESSTETPSEGTVVPTDAITVLPADAEIGSSTEGPIDEIIETTDSQSESTVTDTPDTPIEISTSSDLGQTDESTSVTLDISDTTDASIGDNVGQCTRDGVSYTDGEAVPTTSLCHDGCRCYNSVVECDHPACPPKPPVFLRCEAIQQDDKCCPSYDCGKFLCV